MVVEADDEHVVGTVAAAAAVAAVAAEDGVVKPWDCVQ
jgi:hypothetical protein